MHRPVYRPFAQVVAELHFDFFFLLVCFSVGNRLMGREFAFGSLVEFIILVAVGDTADHVDVVEDVDWMWCQV